MASIRFVDVPYEEKDGLPQLFMLDPSAYGITPASILDEAIRFYNYPAQGYYASTTVWQAFSKKHLNKAIPVLHDVLRKDIVTMVHKLYGGIPGHVDKKKYEESHGKWLEFQSEYGSMCAELLVSPKYRSEKKLKLLERHPNKVHFREFERLTASLGLLRTWVDRVENIYQEHYSKALFEPAWGGSWIVKPPKDIFKTKDRVWSPDKPIYPYEPGEAGPTEKLYFSLSSEVFKSVHNVSFARSKGHFGRTKDVFLQRIHGQSKDIRKIMPHCANPKKIKIWNIWIRNLEHLAYIFEKALEVKDSEVWFVSEKTEEYVTGIRVKDCGVRVGLPAALGLIGMLYAYITDIMARTLMSALSSAIIDIYEEINGYTAIGLYEALSGKETIAPHGKNSVIDKESLGSLKRWRTLPKWDNDVWQGSIANQEVSKIFKTLLDHPLITKKEWGEKPAYKKQKVDIGNGISFDEFGKCYIPRYPVITRDFYRSLSVTDKFLRNWFADERQYGATFEAQLQAFVAFQLLQKSREVLHWDWGERGENKFKTKENDKVLKKRRRLQHFFITAGSFVWGGRKPPHLTHREGINFDFIFGPDLVSWPVAEKITNDIFKFKNSDKGKKFLNSCSECKFLTKRWKPKVLVICYTKSQEKREKTLWLNRPHIVFRPFVQDRIIYGKKNGLVKIAKDFFKKKNDGHAPYYSDKEEAFYKEAEKALAGTPHFINIKLEDASSLSIAPEEITELGDWQKTHAGHLSILLSAPKLIIHASPIIHFRALHAIRRSIKKEGIFIFSLDCVESWIKYLNDPISNEIPQGLKDVFSENNIPLLDDHRIEVVQKDCEWVLTNCDSKYILNVSDKGDSIKVYWPIPQNLINGFSELLKYTGFGFLPHNHQNHWHVNYQSSVSNSNPSLESEGFGSLLIKIKQIWLLLSVDLRPFRDYLSKYRINDNSLLNNVANEKNALLNLLNVYIQEFENRYGSIYEDPFPDQIQQRTISQKVIEEIFGAFKNKNGSSLIQPTVGKEHIKATESRRLKLPVSAELNNQIDISEKLLFKNLVPILYKPQDIRAFEWRLAFIREQEPIKVIERAIDVDEPELDDFEEIIA